VLDIFARLTEDYEEDRHLIPKDHLVELRYEDFVKDPVAHMRDIYARLDIEGFAEAEAAMREFLGERSEHQVSRYELPEPLKRKVIARLKPYIDRFGYRQAVEAAKATAPVRETEPS
jgi:tRNA nucleotidyltransferase (CCA-adding enzyme)